uniref:Uncharacterized protein n=1 Tax=Rhizophora mucronata TaxID=61149 RepID=A0A2P2PW16_RHIMU
MLSVVNISCMLLYEFLGRILFTAKSKVKYNVAFRKLSNK